MIFVDFYLVKRLGLLDEYAHRTHQRVNVAVLLAWTLPVLLGLYFIFYQGLFAAYAVIPCWIACGVLYLALSVVTQKKAAVAVS